MFSASIAPVILASLIGAVVFFGVIFPISIMLTIFALSVAVYFLPTLIALGRQIDNVWAVFLVNLLLGWSGIVWVGALVWSVAAQPRMTYVTS